MPQITPQSPNAAGLGQYGEVPVSLSNGIPNISVPLFTIKEGSFELPISLSYHNNGLQVDQLASYAGLGWDVQAGGIITVEQRGNNDFDVDGLGMFTSTSINPNSRDSLSKFLRGGMSADNQYNYLESIMRGDVDAEYDLYHYNFMGHSGSFYFDSSEHIICVPKSNFKITFQDGIFKFIDERGNQYYFGQIESNTMAPPDGVFATRKSFSNNASYLLSGIITSENRGISFGYLDYPINYVRTSWYLSVYGPKLFSACPTTSTNDYEMIYTLQNSLLSSISFDDGTVVFDLSDSDRLDLRNLTSTLHVPYLKSIKLLNAQNYVIDSFAMHCSYFGGNTRLRLDSVERTNAGIKAEKWKFTYNNPDVVPAYFIYGKDHWGYYNGTDPDNSIPAARYDTLVFLWTTDLPATSDRSSNVLSEIDGVLSSITYPTGGKTNLQYEQNQVRFRTLEQLTANPFLQFNPSDLGDMVDVANANTDITGTTTGTFTLTSPELVTVTASKLSDPFSFIQSDVVLTRSTGGSSNIIDSALTFTCSSGNCGVVGTIMLSPATYTYTVYKNVDSADNPTDGHANLDIQALQYDTANPRPYPIGGIRVASIINTDGFGDTLTKKYIYSDRIDSVVFRNIPYYITFNQIRRDHDDPGVIILCDECNPEFRIQDESVIPLTGNPVEYRYVSELEDDNGINGKTDYIFSSSVNLTTDIGKPYLTPFIATWRSGLPISKKIYRRSGTSYVLLEHDSTTFENTPADSVVNGVRADYTIYCEETGPSNRTLGTSTENYQTERFDPQKSNIILYDSTGAISNDMSNFYLSSKHTLPTETDKTNSKGQLVKEITKFSFDYDTTTCVDAASRGIKDLQQKNVLLPIERLSVKKLHDSDYVVGGLIMAYDTLATVPTSVYQLRLTTPILLSSFSSSFIDGDGVFESDSRYEERAEFNLYDTFNNVLQERYANNTYMSYVWDYQRLHLIAQATNAKQQDIAYTSFEADGKGNWTIGSSSRDSANAITGSHSYVLSSNISKSGLNSSTTYVVSYWTQNSSSFNISGTISGYPIRGKTINGWTLYTHRVAGDTAITISGSGHIDELRLYPLGAQMITYTYTPLIGMTGQCDVGNRITYYEYDALRRLIRIRDQDKNILKTLDYQYQAASGCGNNCYISQMQTLARTSTISYPVGVFNVHGKLLGNATNQAGYISLWNADTANAHVATISAGADPMHFQVEVDSGKSLPAITGCRYYQYDLSGSQLDGVRNFNGTYVDFGDSTGMHLGKKLSDTPQVLASNTVYHVIHDFSYFYNMHFDQVYLIHTYGDTITKTITFYHNDSTESCWLDNYASPATSLMKLKNLRGYLPQNTNYFAASCYQIASALSIDSIKNWNTISSITDFRMNNGDGAHPDNHISYAQDFLKNDRGLIHIDNTGTSDTSFKLSRLKSDWNTYFTNLQELEINDSLWNRENISGFPRLRFFEIFSAKSDAGTLFDSVINQIAAGAGQTVSNGAISVSTTNSGANRSSASDAAVAFLKSKGWVVAINNVFQ